VGKLCSRKERYDWWIKTWNDIMCSSCRLVSIEVSKP